MFSKNAKSDQFNGGHFILYQISSYEFSEVYEQNESVVFNISQDYLLNHVYNDTCCVNTHRPLVYERVYLPLCQVADTPFHIQGDEIGNACQFEYLKHQLNELNYLYLLN